jgi:putative transposase
MSVSAGSHKLADKTKQSGAKQLKELPELIGPAKDASAKYILKGYKHKITVTDERLINLLYQQAGCRRFLYNHFLKLHTTMWQEQSESLTKKQASALLTQLKRNPEYHWLNNVAAQPLQQALQDLYTAFDRFFKGVGNYPKVKQRQAGDSFRLPDPQRIRVRVKYSNKNKPYYQVYLQKLGWYNLINCYQDQLGEALYEGELRSATISRNGNDWYISFACRVQKPVCQGLDKPDTSKPGISELVANELGVDNSKLGVDYQAANQQGVDKQSVGIDRGVKISMAMSDGSVFHTIDQENTVEGARARRRNAVSKQRIKDYQRKLARQELGSSNRQKTKNKLRAEHKRIYNRKLDRIHKQTKLLTSQYSLIVIEDLKVKNMTKSASGTIDNPGINVAQKRGLNRVISEQSWGEMARQLEYKSKWNNGQLISVSAAYTSRTCSACNYQSKKSRKNQSVFSCINCGHTENADINAGKVVKLRGVLELQDLRAQQGLGNQQDLNQPQDVIMTGGTPAQALSGHALIDRLENAPSGPGLDNGSEDQSKQVAALDRTVSKRDTNPRTGKKENKTIQPNRRRQTPKSTQDE